MSKFTSFYVVSAGANRERLANDGKFYMGSVRHGNGATNLKEFKRLGWAKKAAVKAVNESPWVGDVIVIGLHENEALMQDGLVYERTNEGWLDRGRGRQVAIVVKSNLQTQLFG